MHGPGEHATMMELMFTILPDSISLSVAQWKLDTLDWGTNVEKLYIRVRKRFQNNKGCVPLWVAGSSALSPNRLLPASQSPPPPKFTLPHDDGPDDLEMFHFKKALLKPKVGHAR